MKTDTTFLSLSYVQLTSLTTWSAATDPDQHNTSTSPPWRRHLKGCSPVAPTSSNPSSPMTTNTIISPGSGPSLSRKTGNDSASPSSIDVFFCFAPLFFFFFFSFCHSIISVWIMCWLKLLLSPSIDNPPPFPFLFLNSDHFIIPLIVTLSFVCTRPFCQVLNLKKWRKQTMCTTQILRLWFVYKRKIIKKKYI